MIELILIFALLCANGLFAMTEIAIVSARRARLKTMAEEGDKGAAVALQLAEEPNRFLSTVQVGITLTGIIAGAFGGSNLSAQLGELLAPLPLIGPYAPKIAFSIVIVGITYFSLVVGELVPKRLAMIRPEKISSIMSRPMAWLSMAAGPAVTFLGWSTDCILRLFGAAGKADDSISKEEVAVLVREGMTNAAFRPAERELVERVFELARLDVSAIMTPRQQIVWLQQETPHESLWHRIATSNHFFFPIYNDDPEAITGYISIKTLYCQLAAGIPVHLADIMLPPLIVPEHQQAIKLLETFKEKRVHVAFVVNEFGGVEGMVTLGDVLEAIVGTMPSREERAQPKLAPRPDGTWMIDGIMEIEEVVARLPGFPEPEGSGEEFHTLAGFLIDRLQGVPKEGETLEYAGWQLEVVDMDAFRVDKVLVTPMPTVEPLSPAEEDAA